jgi:photosystem II protein PsbQ
MKAFRSVLALLLAVVAVVLVSCGSPKATVPPTYEPEQIAIIQQYATGINEMRDRLPELEPLIRSRRPMEIRALIRGPLGELRAALGNIEQTLLPSDRRQTHSTANDLIKHLENLDSAASTGRYNQASDEYQAVVKDFDRYLDLLPKA